MVGRVGDQQEHCAAASPDLAWAEPSPVLSVVCQEMQGTGFRAEAPGNSGGGGRLMTLHLGPFPGEMLSLV